MGTVIGIGNYVGGRGGAAAVPSGPSGLTLTVISDTEIQLDWSSTSTNQDGYRIYISTDGVTYTEKGTSLTIHYHATVLTAGTLYYFKVVVYKGTIESLSSNIASATTLVVTDIWLSPESIDQADNSDVLLYEDNYNNNDFTSTNAASAPTIRHPVPYVYSILTTEFLMTTLSGADKVTLDYLEVYMAVYPSFTEPAVSKILLSYREISQELVQIIRNTSLQLGFQFRTNTGSISTTNADMHVKRFNILHFIFDKANNYVKLGIDGVYAQKDYTFGAQLIRSTVLYFMNYYVKTVSSEFFGMGDVFINFTNKLNATDRTNLYNFLENKYNTTFELSSTNKTLASFVAETPVATDYFDPQDIYDLVTAGTIQLIDINVGDDPQTKFDNAPSGSLLRFKSGTHTCSPNLHRSLLYVSKQMYIELEASSILKLANNSNTFDTSGEIKNYPYNLGLDDLTFRGTFNGTAPENIVIYISLAANPDKFSYTTDNFGNGNLITITGGWQTIGATGIDIKFNAVTGHILTDDRWYIVFDGNESYGIRIGNGFQDEYINDVVIFGDGVIDMNDSNQISHSVISSNVSSGILINGRCNRTIINGVTIQNAHRSIMCYGENNGTYIANGFTSGGEDFNVKNTKIIDTTTLNNFNTGSGGYGILLGHPEHRGYSMNMICNLNNIDSYYTGIESNLNLIFYEVRNNYVRTITRTYDIHAWRESRNGIICNNNADVITTGQPVGWQKPSNIYATANVRS